MPQNKKINPSLAPQQFNIDNYESTARLTAQQWYENLLHRLFVNTYQEQSDIEMAKMINLRNISTGSRYEKDHTSGFFDQFLNRKSVSTLTRDEHIHMLKTPKLRHGNAFALVDLAVPSSILEKDFKSWIEEQRQQLNINARKIQLTKTKLRDWHNSMVLPYIDLIKWHELNKTKITDSEMGKILFPITHQNDCEVGEKIKRTTRKKHAQNILSKSNLRALVAQANQI
ncbi:DUF6387 family protein [uncultured Cycloclasticus sp.]|uniref:DUF6387 family protein n=1 Tax=uncultured Cycloclasticus sp. TaxID=172194 RepID=UPI002587C50A|nr:DUF6387 family protein [uncultured Cycloclasticus sp.]|tara:strand:+ start:2273 stop:2956 length:684 start_codon:yes stop_codon:yes gene_type:complete